MPNHPGNNLSWNIEVNTPYPIHHCCRPVTYFIHLLKVQFPALCFQAHWGIRILFSPFLSSRILILEYKRFRAWRSLLRIFFSSCLLSPRRQTLSETRVCFCEYWVKNTFDFCIVFLLLLLRIVALKSCSFACGRRVLFICKILRLQNFIACRHNY